MRALLAPIVLFLGCAHASTEQVVLATSAEESFHEVELDGAFDVEIVVGPRASVELAGDEKAVENADVQIHDGRLQISMADRRPMDGALEVKITTPRLESIEINGAADLELTGMKTGELTVEVNGAGSTRAQGHVDSLALEINGAGSVDAVDLVASRVDVEIGGAGTAKVHAVEELYAELSGVGTIRYAGDPASIEKQVSGVGTIRPL